MDIQQTFEELRNRLTFDLENGPYITGSLLTYMIESSFRKPNWTPDDIDIVCRTQSQLEAMDAILSPLASNVSRYHWTTSIIRWDFVDLFGGISIQAIHHDLAGSERVRWVDTTITSIASDTHTHIMAPTTIEDIRSGILRENTNVLRLASLGVSRDYVESRYDKYIRRGYVDFENQIKNKINSL